MLKSMSIGFGLVVIIAVAGIAQAESLSFSTDFSGTSLPSGLTADTAGITPNPVTVNDGLTIYTPSGANIWANSFGGSTVRYSLNPTDTRDFTIEAVVSARSITYADAEQTNTCAHSGIIMVFGSGDNIRTGMFGPYNDATRIRYEDNINQGGGVDGWGNVDSILGSNLSFYERIERHGSDYTFSFKNSSTSDWVTIGTLGTSYGFDSTGPTWIGLYGSCWGGGTETCTYSSFSFTPVPEPSTIVLVLTGVLGLLAYAWRKKK